MLIKLSVNILFITGLTACGGSDSSNEVNPPPPVPIEGESTSTVFTGTFIDSRVENLHYFTDSIDGATNEFGEYNYQTDEVVTFSIGDINFPAAIASSVITPLNVFNSQNLNHTSVTNMLRLLQTLDTDGDASNGIQISELVHTLATGINIDFSASDFDSQVVDLVAMSGAQNIQLLSSAQATSHFQQSLDTIEQLNSSVCGDDHEKVGSSGFFETLAHNVAGKATIIDNCTIKISQFDYDGGGPKVYFYAGIAHAYDSVNAFNVSQNISGSVFQNGELLLRLPNDKSLDNLDGLSVWCTDFNADFGHMNFSQ